MDLVKDFISRVSRKGSTGLAAIAYIPFAGWLVPLYLRRENHRCQTHAKQGLLLAAFFTSVILCLSLVNVLLPEDWREIRLALVVLIYGVYLLYAIFCIVGVIWSLNRKELMLPLVERYVALLKL